MRDTCIPFTTSYYSRTAKLLGFSKVKTREAGKNFWTKCLVLVPKMSKIFGLKCWGVLGGSPPPKRFLGGFQMLGGGWLPPRSPLTYYVNNASHTFSRKVCINILRNGDKRAADSLLKSKLSKLYCR